MTILWGLAESLKTMNRPGPTQPDPPWPGPDRNALWRLISWKVWKIETWNFNTTFIQVFNLCYKNSGSISLIILILYVFLQRRISVIFSYFFYHNFRFKWKFWNLRVPSDPIYIYQNVPYFKFRKHFLCIKIKF